jgi:hypothetical protein
MSLIWARGLKRGPILDRSRKEHSRLMHTQVSEAFLRIPPHSGKKKKEVEHQWLTPVILATREAEIGRIMV